MDMKKTYETPKAEVERYQLDASIASNCETDTASAAITSIRLRHTVLQKVCTMYSFIRRIRATVTRQQAAVTGHPEHKKKQKKRGTGDAHHVMPWRRENLSGL